MLLTLVFSFFALNLSGVHAQDLPTGAVYRQGLELITLESALSQINPGSVLVLGEQHGTAEQAHQQCKCLKY